MNHCSLIILGCMLLFQACGPDRLEPVDLFPEDMCSSCRMAVSDPSFASEIITDDDEVFKFDDLQCLGRFRKTNPTLRIAGMFVKDYDTRAWIQFEKSVIVKTSIKTPMGSGEVAVASAERARALQTEFPPTTAAMMDACCSPTED